VGRSRPTAIFHEDLMGVSSGLLKPHRAAPLSNCSVCEPRRPRHGALRKTSLKMLWTASQEGRGARRRQGRNSDDSPRLRVRGSQCRQVMVPRDRNFVGYRSQRDPGDGCSNRSQKSGYPRSRLPGRTFDPGPSNLHVTMSCGALPRGRRASNWWPTWRGEGGWDGTRKHSGADDLLAESAPAAGVGEGIVIDGVRRHRRHGDLRVADGNAIVGDSARSAARGAFSGADPKTARLKIDRPLTLVSPTVNERFRARHLDEDHYPNRSAGYVLGRIGRRARVGDTLIIPGPRKDEGHSPSTDLRTAGRC